MNDTTTDAPPPVTLGAGSSTPVRRNCPVTWPDGSAAGVIWRVQRKDCWTWTRTDGVRGGEFASFSDALYNLHTTRNQWRDPQPLVRALAVPMLTLLTALTAPINFFLPLQLMGITGTDQAAAHLPSLVFLTTVIPTGLALLATGNLVQTWWHMACIRRYGAARTWTDALIHKVQGRPQALNALLYMSRR